MIIIQKKDLSFLSRSTKWKNDCGAACPLVCRLEVVLLSFHLLLKHSIKKYREPKIFILTATKLKTRETKFFIQCDSTTPWQNLSINLGPWVLGPGLSLLNFIILLLLLHLFHSSYYKCVCVCVCVCVWKYGGEEWGRAMAAACQVKLWCLIIVMVKVYY